MSVRGVFVSPADIRPVFANHTVTAEHMHHTRSDGRGMLPLRRAGIEALVSASSMERTEFLCILTIQQGEAPKVTVEGTGLDAKVTVGGQRVRFDGKRIVFGE
jgi:hypothetical protein